jgi:hypothetical protein
VVKEDENPKICRFEDNYLLEILKLTGEIRHGAD